MPSPLTLNSSVRRNTRWLFVSVIVMSMWMAICATAQSDQSDQTEPGAASGHFAKVIRLAISDAPRGSVPYRMGNLVYTEAFRRLGYGFELHVLPLERALLEADAGRMDGDAARVEFNASMTARYANLIRVPEQVIEIEVAAYANDKSIRLSGWEDLARSNLRIGHPRGYKVFERYFRNDADNKNIFEIRNVRQGLKMLQYGRIDVFIGTRISSENLLASRDFVHSKIINVGTIDTAPMFPYLHRKHMALVPRLANVLKAMKSEGRYLQLIEKAKEPEPRLEKR